MALLHWFQLNGDTKDYGVDCEIPSIASKVTYSDTGKLGKAMKFSLTLYQYLTIDNPFIGLSEWTMSMWVRNDSANAWSDIFAFSGDGHFRLEFDDVNNRIFFYVESDGNSPFPVSTTASVSFTKNVWHLITLVYDNGKSAFYMDGKLSASATRDCTFTSDAAKIYFGSRSSDVGFADISINDIRLYDEALSESDIYDLSKCLVMHYNFEQDSGLNYFNQTKFEGMPDSHSSENNKVTMTKSNGEITLVGTEVGSDIAIAYSNLSPSMTDEFTDLAGKKILLSLEYKVNSTLTQGSTSPWIGLELISFNSSGSHLDGMHSGNIDYNESSDWKVTRSYFTINKDTTRLQYCVGMRDYTGSITVRHPKIELVDDSTISDISSCYPTPFIENISNNDSYNNITRSTASKNLVALYHQNYYHYSGGFEGTPYIEISGENYLVVGVINNLKPNTAYTLSVRAKSIQETTSTPFSDIRLIDVQTGVSKMTIDVSSVFVASDAWNFNYRTFTTGSDIFGPHRLVFTTTNSVNISEIQLEEGSEYTPYTNPEIPPIMDVSGYGNNAGIVKTFNGTTYGNIIDANTDCPVGRSYLMLGNDTDKDGSHTGALFGLFKNPIYSVLDFTIIMWVKIFQSGTKNSGLLCISKKTSTSTGIDYSGEDSDAINSFDSNIRINFFNGNYVNIPASLYTQFAGDGEWHMLAITRNGAEINSYADGSLIGSATCTATDVLGTFRTVSLGRSIAGGVYRNCKMAIADFKIYLSGMTSNEIYFNEFSRSHIDKKYKLSSYGFGERSILVPATANPNYPSLAFNSPGGSNGVFNIRTKLIENNIELIKSLKNYTYDEMSTNATFTNNGASIDITGHAWITDKSNNYLPFKYGEKYIFSATFTTEGGSFLIGIEEYDENYNRISNDYKYSDATARTEYTIMQEVSPISTNSMFAKIRILNDWDDDTGTSAKKTTISKLSFLYGDNTVHFATYDDGTLLVDRISEI